MKNVEINSKIPQETVTISREEYNNLIAQNKELSQKVLWLMETINLNNKKMFGSSSEKTVEEESAQLSIFNEAEEIANIKRPEPELEEVKSHYRKKRTKKDRLPGDLPVEIIEYRLNEEELDCPNCGEELHEMGKEIVREELKIIPAHAVAHARRKFDEALKCLKEEERKDSKAAIGLAYCNRLLDFTYYFIQKYDKMCKEDEVLADMTNYYLFEKAFDIHKNAPEEKLRMIMKKALKELNSDDIL